MDMFFFIFCLNFYGFLIGVRRGGENIEGQESKVDRETFIKNLRLI